MLTQEKLRSSLRYDEKTGYFFWLHSLRARRKAGDRAGVVDLSNGYIKIGIGGGRYYAHRLAWFYMTGEWPTEIDHIDRNRANNTWANLRLATSSGNAANRKTRASLSGYKGVGFYKNRNCYFAQLSVRIDGRLYNRRLGYFRNAVDAAEAYDVEARKVFGEFARTNFP